MAPISYAKVNTSDNRSNIMLDKQKEDDTVSVKSFGGENKSVDILLVTKGEEAKKNDFFGLEKLTPFCNEDVAEVSNKPHGDALGDLKADTMDGASASKTKKNAPFSGDDDGSASPEEWKTGVSVWSWKDTSKILVHAALVFGVGYWYCGSVAAVFFGASQVLINWRLNLAEAKIMELEAQFSELEDLVADVSMIIMQHKQIIEQSNQIVEQNKQIVEESNQIIEKSKQIVESTSKHVDRAHKSIDMLLIIIEEILPFVPKNSEANDRILQRLGQLKTLCGSYADE